MYTFCMLGSISATSADHRNVDALLRQPKHVALLAYLALPTPGVWHRRDSVLGIFWSELDQARARSALRSALYVLRRHLPDGVVLTRGDDELSLDASAFVTDVGRLLDDVANARYEQALSRYTGDLLPGAYVAEAPAFERWLEQERSRVRAVACAAAAHLSEQRDQAGNLQGAIAAARRGAELSPDDEAATRRWIALLDRAGDRAGAFAVYEKFRNHMVDAFGVRPSAETVALLDAVRTRREPGFVASALSVEQPSFVATSSAVNQAKPADRTPEGSVAVRRRRWPLVASLVAIAATLTIVVLQPRTNTADSAPAPRALVVLPMINETGDTAYDYVATGVAAGVARRLQSIGGLTIRSGAQSSWSDSIRNDYPAIAREFRAATLLKTSLHTVGDSLEVQVAMLDSTGTVEREIVQRRFALTGMRDAEGKLAAAIAAGVFRQQISPGSHDSISFDQGESYRLTMQGTQLLLNFASARRSFRVAGQTTMPQEARKLFKAAVELDPQNAAALSGISSTYAIPTLTDLIPFDDGYRMTALAAEKALAMDSSQAAALANLAITTALKSRSLTAGLRLMDAAVRADPSNTETWVIKSALYRHAHRYDEARDAIRVARELDPFTSLLLDREATLEICANNPPAALELYKSELVLNPSDPFVHAGMVRTLALLGRYDDALIWWRKKAESERDTARMRTLKQANARGKDGYWTLVHRDGQRRLDALLARRDGGMERVSSLKLMQAFFAAGDFSRGFAELEKLEAAQTPALFRLMCMADLDEVRSEPRFAAALKRIGALPR